MSWHDEEWGCDNCKHKGYTEWSEPICMFPYSMSKFPKKKLFDQIEGMIRCPKEPINAKDGGA